VEGYWTSTSTSGLGSPPPPASMGGVVRAAAVSECFSFEF